MEPTWWGVEVFCPEDKSSCILQAALFSADGELRFAYWCPQCKQAIQYRVFACALAHRALLNDMAKAGRKQCRGREPLQPPTTVPPPQITDEDRKFLKDLGIEEKGDGDETL